MPPRPHATGDTVSANLTLKVGSYELQATLTVPAAPIKPQAVLPALNALVDAVIGAAERELDGTDRSVSCKPGCAACCRQAVSISAIEAYHIRDLVDVMPEPHRAAVMTRFADVGRRTKAAGLYDSLLDPSALSADQREAMALDYLALGIPCPFLEDERCSIYADRPLRCREYLVTSPPERCATPGDGDLDPVPVPKLSRALMRTGAVDGVPTSWPPLSLALDWVAAHPDDLPLQPGPAWVRDILGRAGDPPPAEAPPTEPEASAEDEADAESGGVALPMPSGEVSAVDMLPTFRAYTEAAVAHAIDFSAGQGKPPSCRAGCGACCRHQLIAISSLEARRIAAIVEEMPEPRRSDVRARFADADRRIAAWTESAGQAIGLNHGRQSEDQRLASYFALGIACPLLENDSCSIYEERPLVCREYLVTSPAENCGRLEENGVTVEAIPRLFTDVALAHLTSDEAPPRPSRVLLGRSLSWVAANPEPVPTRRSADAWLNRFFERLGDVDNLRQHRDRPAPVHAELPPSQGPAALTLDVPVQPVPAGRLLPALRVIADTAIQQAIAQSEARGKPVSCKAGCNACCRQLVPVSPIEAQALADLVARMPEPGRATVLARFADAEARLSTWEHRVSLDDVDHPQGISAYQLGIDYFRLGIACPFLEDGLCSIHEERPMSCREHLVTSPAAHCSRQGDPGTTIEGLPGAGASEALARLSVEDDGTHAARIPLTTVLSRIPAEATKPVELPGRIWIERMLAFLHGLR